MIYSGLYKGIVSNIDDPEKRGRIKCLIPDVLGDRVESAWCEPCVPVAYDYGGDFCLPQLNETIWLAFEKGNSNFPVYLGNWWQKEMTPLGANYSVSSASSVRIISFDNCSLILKDGKVNIVGDLEVSGSIVQNNESNSTTNSL